MGGGKLTMPSTIKVKGHQNDLYVCHLFKGMNCNMVEKKMAEKTCTLLEEGRREAKERLFELCFSPLGVIKSHSLGR